MMSLSNKKLYSQWAKFILNIIFLLSFINLSRAKTEAVVYNGLTKMSQESYLSRPSVLSLRPQPMPMDPLWGLFKNAHFTFVAYLLEYYSEFNIYFLARDSEYLYDVAKLMTSTQSTSDRVHLLNVSRAHLKDPLLFDYLDQNGISETKLRAGHKALLVDTGYSGTISTFLESKLSLEARKNLNTHFIISDNPNYPSSYSFLIRFYPEVLRTENPVLHKTIVSYEHLPRYTDRSTKYQLLNGVYHPISSTQISHDGLVSKELSIQLMQDLYFYWLHPAVQSRFYFEKERIRFLINLFTNSKTKSEVFNSISFQLNQLQGFEKDALIALIKDMLLSQKNAGYSFIITILDFNTFLHNSNTKTAGKSSTLCYQYL